MTSGDVLGRAASGAFFFSFVLIAQAISACTHDAPDSVAAVDSGPAPKTAVGRPAERIVAAEKVKAAVTAPGLQDVEHACDAICAHSRELKCIHTSQCFANCVGMATITPCNDEVSAFYRCLVKQPTPNWQCDEDGVAAIRDGLCNQEQAAVVSCMQHKGQ